jgi:BASS family bile acid:Na+ symporter
MTAAELIALAIQVSIGLIVASVALNARLSDLVSLWHRPGLLVRSLLSMFVVMPALAVGMALLFDLRPVLEAALIALALAPVPPLLPRKETEKAGGAPSYTVGLLAATALVSIAYVPAALAVVGHIFHRPVHVDVANVAKIVATSIFVPFLAGLAVRRVAPSAARLARPLALVATVLLVLAALPILVKEWAAIRALVGSFSVVAAAGFAIVGLAVGHALGGPDPDDRTVLALSTASRHPALALAIAHSGVTDQQALLAAVLLVVIVSSVVSVPYVKWRARGHARSPSQLPPRAS